MKYDVEKAALVLSVTELCNTALIGGDIDCRPGFGKQHFRARAAIGSAVHHKMQAAGGANYQSEVYFCNSTSFGEITYEVSGRADGIISENGAYTVDEIKTVSAKGFQLPPKLAHDAQLKCYAYFLCREKDLPEVTARLTYYRLEDGEIKHFFTVYRAEELQAFYLSLLSAIEKTARLIVERETVRRPSAAAGKFPYKQVRDGQELMIKECYRDIRSGKKLFIQAPTGTGKTVSSLYPAVRAMGEGIVDKVFYLTAKASTRREAFRAAADIFAAGSHLRTIVLTAREQLCFNERAKADPLGVSRHCNPADCPFARGYYDKMPGVVNEMLEKGNGFNRQAIETYAKEAGICPYELQLDLSMLCDTVICDYNYVFDPQIYLRRYFDEDAMVAKPKYAFLIDEAHNLADRASSMYSVSLKTGDFESANAVLSALDEKTRKEISTAYGALLGFRKFCRDSMEKDADGVEHGFYLSRNPMGKFVSSVAHLSETLDAWMRANRGSAEEETVYLLLSAVKRFELISNYYDERFLTFAEVHGEEVTVRLICMDPSEILHTCLDRAVGSVLFSATLTPQDYFADILGGGKDAVKVALPSPFDRTHVCYAVVPTVSTRLEDREKSYKKIAGLIAATVSAKAGNYIAYFPSYDYMEAVQKAFSVKYPKVETVLQTRKMSNAEKEKFLDAFADDGKMRVGFCVLGGSFSEGVDLPGNRLIGTVIVGTGMPGISNERNILREYYDNTRENGFDYAYTYPGMNRVMQAAGRVIRREEDRGVVVLIDDRYATDRYKVLFPEHWQNVQSAGNAMELAEIVSEFWRNA